MKQMKQMQQVGGAADGADGEGGGAGKIEGEAVSKWNLATAVSSVMIFREKICFFSRGIRLPKVIHRGMVLHRALYSPPEVLVTRELRSY